jgi:hypothetical protein
MQRSSEGVAAIAAALAKAQLELTNPEKSLEGTIPMVGIGGGTRSFRYAPLSTGLDIIRKSLGKYEIATVQTTEIDREAGLVRLTTVLAHSSGEWISSEWPVCAIAQTASPQRMGAALTYARRYALFTLVGIAGEDDVDAPDLGTAPDASGSGGTAHGFDGNGPFRKPVPRPKPALAPDQSAVLRDRMLAEVASLEPEEAAQWAHRSLPVKNTLTTPDAQIVEQAFSARLARSGEHLPNVAPQEGPPGSLPQRRVGLRPRLKTSRLRDKEHRQFVSRQPCVVCGRAPCDAHHLRFAQPRALGLKVSDEYTVPVCRVHHRELHRHGDEPGWWTKANIDPVEIALSLWRQTHPDQATGSSQPSLADALDPTTSNEIPISVQ